MTVEILLVADGASPHTKRLAAALVERGLATGLATFVPSGIDGIVEHRLGERPVDDDVRYALAIPTLARAVARERPRIIHAHYVSSYGVLAAVARRAVPGSSAGLVQTAWGSDLLVTARVSRLRRMLAAFALREADLVTADSDDLLAAAARLAPRTPRSRFVFGPPRALLSRARRPEPIVVSARRPDPGMRVPLVVRAFQHARQRTPSLRAWRLVIAGDGAEMAEVRALARDDSSIDIVGHLDRPALHELLLRARVFVSVPESDATSAVLLESLSAGVRPIVNDLPANREWVDATVGRVVSRDPGVDEVASAIVAAASDGETTDACRARVRKVLWEDEVDRLLAAYQTL